MKHLLLTATLMLGISTAQAQDQARARDNALVDEVHYGQSSLKAATYHYQERIITDDPIVEYQPTKGGLVLFNRKNGFYTNSSALQNFDILFHNGIKIAYSKTASLHKRQKQSRKFTNLVKNHTKFFVRVNGFDSNRVHEYDTNRPIESSIKVVINE